MTQKIAFFLADLQSGGTEFFALRLARGLAQKGYTPLFLVSRPYGELFSAIQTEFEITTLDGKGYNLPSLLGSLPRIIRFLNKERPDVLMSGLPLINAVAALAVLFTKAETKLIAVEHMNLSVGTGFRSLKKRLKRGLVLGTHFLADAFVCVSQTAADSLHDHGDTGRQPIIIANPIIPENFDRLVNEPITHPWIVKKEGPLLLTVGRLLDIKNYPLLLHAFSLVLQRKPSARLIIIGEGQQRQQIEQIIKAQNLTGQVQLLGAIDNVFPYQKAADLFVLASHSEAFGNVIVESLACGTPVVSTDCGGPREILTSTAFGRLAKNGDAQNLADTMLLELDTPHDKQVLIQYGKSFSVQRAVQAYQKLIDELTSNHSSRS